jgi:hypothetical protein
LNLASDNNGNIYYSGSDRKIYANYYGCSTMFRLDKHKEKEIKEMGKTPEDYIKIYPNPSKGEFDVEYLANEYKEDLCIQVYNYTGSLIFQNEYKETPSHEHRFHINIEGQANGIYMVRFSNGPRIHLIKVVINN